jgi:hypothetical protein
MANPRGKSIPERNFYGITSYAARPGARPRNVPSRAWADCCDSGPGDAAFNRDTNGLRMSEWRVDGRAQGAGRATIAHVDPSGTREIAPSSRLQRFPHRHCRRRKPPVVGIAQLDEVLRFPEARSQADGAPAITRRAVEKKADFAGLCPAAAHRKRSQFAEPHTLREVAKECGDGRRSGRRAALTSWSWKQRRPASRLRD